MDTVTVTGYDGSVVIDREQYEELAERYRYPYWEDEEEWYYEGRHFLNDWILEELGISPRD